MLSIEKRLKNKKDFDRVFKNSRPFYCGKIAMRAAKRVRSDIPTRFGFVVSNKIDKRATRRNALRRHMRSVVRNLISSLSTGYDVVVIVKEKYPYPYEQEVIAKDLVGLLEKNKLIKPKMDR